MADLAAAPQSNDSGRKFGRNYELKVETQARGIFTTIRPPFTLDFDVGRNSLFQAGLATIKVYNLNAITRDPLLKTRGTDTAWRQLTLKAGYGTNLCTILDGSVSECFSYRDGTQIVTQISVQDNGYAFVNAVTKKAQFPAGTTLQSVIQSLMNELTNPENGYHVTEGAVGVFPGTLTRGRAYDGNIPYLLQELTGGGFFIDNSRAFCMNASEGVEGGIGTLNSENGLLGTPIRESGLIRFEMIFEPRLIVGQKLTLESSVVKSFKGPHKIGAIHHRGTISDAICGDAVTLVEAVPGTFQAIGTVVL